MLSLISKYHFFKVKNMTLIQTQSGHVLKLIHEGIERMINGSNENLRNGDLYSQSVKRTLKIVC